MINLKNTYVPNIKGELTDLYVAEAKKQGFVFQSNSSLGDGWKYLFCFSKGIYTSNCVNTEKELTLDDFKPMKKHANEFQPLVAMGKACNGKVPLSTLSHGAIANNKANIAFERASAACNGKVYHKALTCEEIVKIGAEPEITMEIEEGKMKRTVVTYEKVRFNHVWEVVRAFEDGEQLFTNVSSKTYIKIDTLQDVLKYTSTLYRRVATEITPMQAAKNAMHKYIGTSEEIDDSDDINTFLFASSVQSGFDYDNEYIAMIRVTLNAYDGK